MPRIPTQLIRQVSKDSRLIPLLLHTCKSVESAQQELRWIQNELPRDQWHETCVQRGKGVPLQYLLKSQPFGDLDIACDRGVLIPRWETEEWTLKLAGLLGQIKKPLKMIDVCTGTGCIPLLLKHSVPTMTATGVDISEIAIQLSQRNKEFCRVDVEFLKKDLFQWRCDDEPMDLVTANPPYIPLSDYNKEHMEESVIEHEPSLALIGDLEFYEALVHNVVIPSNAQGFVFELGYEKQYHYTKGLLGDNWDTKLYNDGAGKPRCVIGWTKRGH